MLVIKDNLLSLSVKFCQQLSQHRENIINVSARATNEATLYSMLHKLSRLWKNTDFKYGPAQQFLLFYSFFVFYVLFFVLLTKNRLQLYYLKVYSDLDFIHNYFSVSKTSLIFNRLTAHRLDDSGKSVMVIRQHEELLSQLEESQMTISTLKGSRYVEPIKVCVFFARVYLYPD